MKGGRYTQARYKTKREAEQRKRQELSKPISTDMDFFNWLISASMR